MVYIRADANNEIATGHILRCSAIAEAFVEEGNEISFIVADEYGGELVSKLGYPCFVLGSDYKDMEGELATLKSIIGQYSSELLLVDSYYVTDKYFKNLKDITRTAYIDDYLGYYLSCDIVINYDLDVARDYYRDYTSEMRFLLGGRYTPLRKQFRNVRGKQINDIVSEMLILTGGSDHFHVVYNICKALLSSIDKFDGCIVNIVCGQYNADYNRILEITRNYSRFRAFKVIDEIDLFMKRADVCVSAGGTTTKELAACGTPTITFSVANNQLENVKSLDRAGMMKYFGDVRDISFSYNGLIEELILLCEDKERRIRESRLLQKTIDGLGAVRIARELIK